VLVELIPTERNLAIEALLLGELAHQFMLRHLFASALELAELAGDHSKLRRHILKVEILAPLSMLLHVARKVPVQANGAFHLYLFAHGIFVQ
jgi:hypothetical protein